MENDFNNQGNTYSYSYRQVETTRPVTTAPSGGQYNTPPVKTKKKSGFGVKILKCIVLALVFGLVAGSTFSGVVYVSNRLIGDGTIASNSIALGDSANTTESGVEDKSVAQNRVPTATMMSSVSDVSDIVQDVMPSIVAVTNSGVVQKNTWFGIYEQEYKSSGSGIIISQDSENIYIATNHHVVSGAKTLSVTFNDKAEAEGVIKGSDSSVDLAIIAVSLADIPSATRNNISVASIGESTTLKVGQPSIVIGNALGYGQSVTTGVISALSREVKLQNDDGTYMTNYLIQTDAAVNPGNSGGAMLNVAGEVIGIVSAKYSDTDVEGMGYAIPISEAFAILEQMISNDVVSSENSSYLGIAGLDVNSYNAKGNMPNGVLVTQVVPGSAAESIGIVKGDIITGLNGRTVTSMNSISNILKYLPAGTVVDITVAKEDNDYVEKTYEVTLTNRNNALTR